MAAGTFIACSWSNIGLASDGVPRSKPSLSSGHRYVPMTGRAGSYIVYDRDGRRIGIMEPRTGSSGELRFVPDAKK